MMRETAMSQNKRELLRINITASPTLNGMFQVSLDPTQCPTCGTQ